MRVLILWADHTSINLGVQVLARGAEEFVRQTFGEDTEIQFMDWYSAGAVRPSSISLVRDLLKRRDGALKRHIAKFDVVFDTCAGDSFTDIYGLKRLGYEAYMHAVAHKVGVPVVMGPQTIGPFNSFLGRSVGKAMASRVRALIARDSKSARYSSDHLRRDADIVTTDVVFLLPRVTSENGPDGIVLNVSGLLWNANSHVDDDLYRRLLHDTAQYINGTGAKLTLLAHVVDEDRPESDTSAVRELSDALGFDHSVVVPRSLDEVRKTIAGSELLIGARMHACLNAISLGVPAIPLAYSRKFDALMRDIRWPYTVSLTDGENKIRERVQELILMRAAMQGEVSQVSEDARLGLHTATRALSKLLEA